MKTTILASAAALLLLSSDAFAGDPPAGPDMSKMGPWSRKAKNEKKIKKEINAAIKAMDALAKKGDFDGALKSVDFPVYMMTDDATGKAYAEPWDKARYTKELKPFWDNMPKNSSTKHNLSITVLSDSLVTVVDNFTMKMGKAKFSGKNTSMLVKVGGKWKWKVMAEAGWGGMPTGATAKK